MTALTAQHFVFQLLAYGVLKHTMGVSAENAEDFYFSREYLDSSDTPVTLGDGVVVSAGSKGGISVAQFEKKGYGVLHRFTNLLITFGSV